MNFLNDLEPLLKTFWYIAIPVSLIFIIQTIMTFVGGDAMDGVEADFDSDLTDTEAPFQLFSLRNLINFLIGFSWSGISFYDYILNDWLLIGTSLIIGLAFVFLFFLVIQQVNKLAEDNTFKIESTLHQNGEVYTTIPAHMKGTGKILIAINGSTRELPAATRNESLEQGTLISVTEVQNQNLLIVKKI